MKITTLLETNTTTSDPVGLQSQQAPKFGRDPNVLEDEQLGETTAGCVASVAQPIGGVKTRGKGDIFTGIKTSKKFPNSKQVSEGEPGDLEHELEKQEQERDRKRDEEAEEELKEGAYDEGVSDGIQGTPNRRASSIYGPEAGEYQRGYEIGVKKGEQLKKERLSKSQADTSPYENMSDQELMQLRKEIQQRSNQRQEIYSKLRGSSLSFDPKVHLPKNDSELRMQHAQDNKAWNAINQVLGQRGVNVNNLSEGVEEAKADPTSTWVVYDGNKVKRFKTHEGAKAYAEQHGGKVASSAHYADKIQGKQGVAEGHDDDQPEYKLHKALVYNHGADNLKQQYEIDGDADKLIKSIQILALKKYKQKIDAETAHWIAKDLVHPAILEQGVAEGSEQSFKVTYDVHGGNKEKPLYTKSKTVRAGSEQEAISRLRKLVGGTNHRVEKQDVAENLEEAEISEEMLAHELYKDLQIFKKGADKDIGKKAKDKEIGKKPKDRDIVTKEQQ